MAISRVAGQMLDSTLERDGVNLAVADTANTTPVLYIDIANNQIGVNTDTPNVALDIVGNINSGNANVTANILTGNILTDGYYWANGVPVYFAGEYSNANVANYLPTYSGNINSGNVTITGNLDGNTANFTGNIATLGILTDGYYYANGAPLNFEGNYSNANVAAYLPTYFGNIGVDTLTSNANSNITLIPDGSGIVVIANTSGGSTGIQLGPNTLGQLVSNAVALSETTSVTNGIAQLNLVLGKLVPPAPPAFPASQTLSISGLATYRMANITQVNNTANSYTVAAGATVTKVLRAATYATNTISTAGPGDSGTVTAYRNGNAVGNVTLTGTSNGTYGGNLVISNNQDYNSSNASIARGFWYVFSAAISGTNAPAGWNDILITDSAAGNTNVPSWYYDNSSPGTPTFSSVSITPPANAVVTYSSTIPHYTNVNQFPISFTVSRISGNMYPTTDTFVTGAANGALGAPASVTYQASSLGTNVLDANASANVTTTSTVISGFGGSAADPTISVNNSYATGTQAFDVGAIVLYKTGNATAINEGNIVIGSPVGSGSGNAFRIVNPGTGNTPVYTGSEAAFDSQNGPLYTYDAICVGSGAQGIITFSQTNFASGYLPVGPNLSTQGTAQWFTFKFVRTATSKFNISIAGTVGGVWVALPGSVFDGTIGPGPTSSLNGWLNMALPYGGAGIPGANSINGGNGSDGCSLGGSIPLNTAINSSYTCTFGTVSSTSTATNEIYVRIRLTSGQSLTGLSIQTASN